MHGYINGGWVATYLCGGKNKKKVEDVGKVMKVSVTPGKTYAVTTSEECTITSSDGTTIATCAAGEQMVFVAPCSTVEVSSDTAVVVESFRSASTGGNVSRGYVQDAIEEATEGLPQVDASGNMTLEGGLTAGGKINANGGINVPTEPINDNDVVRLVDVATPAKILPLFSQRTVTPMRYLRGACITTNGVTIATGDTPFVLTNNRVKDNGDDNWAAFGFHTFVLELNPFRFSTNNAYTPEGKYSQQNFGVRANFGLTSSPWETAPASIYSQIDMNDLLQPIKLHSNEWGYCPVASIWPGSASSDFRARVGFQQRRENLNKSEIDTEKLNQYLFACYDRRNIVRIIQCYARHSPALDPNHSYLFSQDRSGVIKLIGYVYHSYEWQVPCLWMTAHGQCGIQGCWHISQDIFGLADACMASWPGGTRPAGEVSWPIQQSVFIADNSGGTFTAYITADDKTYTLSDDVPDWISAVPGENSGEVTLTVSANDTGAQRDGLVNFTLFNEIMYTIVIRQSA